MTVSAKPYDSSKAFIQIVRDFLANVDRIEQIPSTDFLLSCARLLPRIYALGIELPSANDSDRDYDGIVPNQQRRIAAVLGGHDFYQKLTTPADKSITAARVSADLTAIYLDLARPLSAHEENRESDALVEWKQQIAGETGARILHVLGAIHHLLQLVAGRA